MNKVRNIKVFPPRSSSQIGTRRIPRVHFSYNSPVPQHCSSAKFFRPRQSPVSNVPIQQFRTHIYLQKEPSLKAIQNLGQRQDSKMSKKRKRIFDYNDDSIQRDSHSWDQSKYEEKLKIKSTFQNSNWNKRGTRKNIFEGYDPKKSMNVSYNVEDQDGSRSFPIKKPAHPKSLVHYVEVAAYRKKKFFDEVPFFQKQDSSELIKNESFLEDENDIRVSGIKRCDSKITDGPLLEEFDFQLCENPIKNENNNDIPLTEFEAGPRFFDRNNDQISNISNKQSLIDIRFAGSTNFSQLKKTWLEAPAPVNKWQSKMDNISESKSQNKEEVKYLIRRERQESIIEYRPTFSEQEQGRWIKNIQRKNILPLGLICLGILLFLIQIIK